MAVHNEGIKLEFREGRHEEAPETTEEVQVANWDGVNNPSKYSA